MCTLAYMYLSHRYSVTCSHLVSHNKPFILDRIQDWDAFQNYIISCHISEDTVTQSGDNRTALCWTCGQPGIKWCTQVGYGKLCMYYRSIAFTITYPFCKFLYNTMLVYHNCDSNSLWLFVMAAVGEQYILLRCLCQVVPAVNLIAEVHVCKTLVCLDLSNIL